MFASAQLCRRTLVPPYPGDRIAAQEILVNADAAMYRTKPFAGSAPVFFSDINVGAEMQPRVAG
jgi:hypothetical protein